MKKCLEACKNLNTSCPVKDCRYWIDYEQDLNCTLESVNKNDAMTLREVGDRLGLSYVRVKQIQDSVLNKITDKF
jgi:DNA-directed RNA polymerase sigma subunit (sigma70/sigma32)